MGRGGGRARNPDGGSRCLYRSRWEMPAGEPSSTASIDQASYSGSDLTVEGAKGEGMGNLAREVRSRMKRWLSMERAPSVRMQSHCLRLVGRIFRGR